MTPKWRPDADVRPHDLDSAANLDPARLAVFRRYLRQEYAGPFIHSMGSYEILQMAREYICPGRRLDVGSGTAALFWILATDGGIRATANRAADGSLPSGKVIADRYGRHER